MNIRTFSSFTSLWSTLRALVVAAVAALMIGFTPVEAQGPQAPKKPWVPEPVTYTVDVAEDFSLFVPTFVRPGDTQPEPGSFYLTRGRVFPEGTIQGDGSDFDPNRSGHVGVWISRGTHLVSASEIPDARWWATTSQLFVLGRQGRDHITSEGLEGNGTLTRVVTGGAGNFAGWTGEQQTTLLGFNTTGGVNLRVTFVLRPPVK